MSEQKGFPWVNLWMLVFSVGGIWLVWRTLANTHFPESGGMAPYLLALPVLLVIAVTALYRMPVPFTNEQPDDPEPTVTTLGRIYLDAWRTALRQRWILILFGGIALVAVLEGLTMAYIFTPTARNSGVQPAPPAYYLGHVLPADLSFEVCRSPDRFLAVLGAGTRSATGIVPPLVIVALLPWLSIQLRRLKDHQTLGRTAGMLRSILVPIAIMALMAFGACLLLTTRSVTSLLATRTFSSFALFSAPMRVWGIVFDLVAVPFLTGGLIGSLIRTTDGNVVTRETFVRDAVRYLLPFMGFALLLILAETLLDIPSMLLWFKQAPRLPDWWGVYDDVMGFAVRIAKMLLMFVPYAIVTSGLGSRQGIKTGFADWMSHKRTMIRFTALGISVIVPTQLVGRAATKLLGPSHATFVVELLLGILNIAIAAWLSVAVWELYRRIVTSTTSAEAEE